MKSLRTAAAFVLAVFLMLVPLGAIAQNAYVPSHGANNVSVISPVTNTVVATITGFNAPTSAAVTPDGSHVYVANPGASTVSVIDTSTNTITHTIIFSLASPSFVSISPDGTTAYALAPNGVGGANPGSILWSINTSTNTIVNSTTMPSDYELNTLVSSLDGTRLYGAGIIEIGASYYATIFVFDARTLTFLTTISAPGWDLFGIAITPDGTKLYVSETASLTGSTFVDVVDIATGSTLAQIPVAPPYGASPLGIAMSPDGSKAYVGGGANNAYVINTTSYALSLIPLSSYTDGYGVALTPDGIRVFFPSGGPTGNTVLVVDTASNTLVATVPVGNDPESLGQFIQPASGGSSGPPVNAELLGPEDCGCITKAGASSAGEPIDIATGNMAYQFTDYTTAGQNPLAFTRYYNSRGNASGIVTLAGTLGVNWRSTFDRYLQINSSSQVTAERAGGQQYIFTLSGSTWTPNGDVDIKLTYSGSTWTLTDHDDTVETYTTTCSGNAALLNTIQLRNGYTQTLHYNGSNQLTTVTDSYSRSLDLHLQRQRHAQHRDHAGQHHAHLRLYSGRAAIS